MGNRQSVGFGNCPDCLDVLSQTLAPLLKKLLIFALAAGGSFHHLAQAAVTGPGTFQSVTLAWDAVEEPGVQGYVVHVGTRTGEYTRNVEVGSVLSFSLDGLEYGTTYYLSVSAIGANGERSDYSPELILDVSLPPVPPSAAMASVGNETGTTTMMLQWSYPKSALNSYPEFIIESSTDLVNWTPAATVTSDTASGDTADEMTYSWSVEKNGPTCFYRLSARNWLGDSTAP